MYVLYTMEHVQFWGSVTALDWGVLGSMYKGASVLEVDGFTGARFYQVGLGGLRIRALQSF